MLEETKSRWLWWKVHKITQIARFAMNHSRKYMTGTDCVNFGRKLYNMSMDGLNGCPYKEYIPTFLKGTGSGLCSIIVGYRKLGLYYEANMLQRVIENVFAN